MGLTYFGKKKNKPQETAFINRKVQERNQTLDEIYDFSLGTTKKKKIKK